MDATTINQAAAAGGDAQMADASGSVVGGGGCVFVRVAALLHFAALRPLPSSQSPTPHHTTPHHTHKHATNLQQRAIDETARTAARAAARTAAESSL
jgi:hypothetical protein